MALPRIPPRSPEERNKVVTRAVFLDRDGVINANVFRDGRPVAPTRIEEFRILPGVIEAVRRVKAAGFVVVVITNQPDIAIGRTTKAAVAAMHAQIRQNMPVDDIKVCPHVDADNCACRKPKPAMIFEAASELGIHLPESYVVGDRWRDIEAGRAAGCWTIFMDYGYEQEIPIHPDRTVSSLSEAVSFIVG